MKSCINHIINNLNDGKRVAVVSGSAGFLYEHLRPALLQNGYTEDEFKIYQSKYNTINDNEYKEHLKNPNYSWNN